MANPPVGLMRRLGALLIALASGPLPAGAGGEASGAGPAALEVRLRLLDARGAVSAAFRPGEPITLRIALTNPGSTPERLEFSSARTHDAIVRTASGREVWRWSHGRQFAQMLSELTLAPGESRELSLRWDPARAGDAAPGEGDYVAVGLIPALGASIESGTVAFSIRSAK
jgi:hypothetical protein